MSPRIKPTGTRQIFGKLMLEADAAFFYLRIMMRYRALGQTGLRVAEVDFGGWAIGGNQFGQSLGPADDTISLAALNYAYESGCNLFATSDAYGRGHSETLIGKALKGWNREETVIATQGGYDFSDEALSQAPGGKQNFSNAHLTRSVEKSLQRLGVEAIDVYLLHTPPLELIQHGQVFDTLHNLKSTGKIRFAGISIQDPQEGIQAIHSGEVDVIMAIYNLFDTRADKHLFAACEGTGTGLLVREPLARGFLSGALSENSQFEPGDVRAVWPKSLISKRVQAATRLDLLRPNPYQSLAQLALAYSLHANAVSAVLPDCSTPEETSRNTDTVSLPPLSVQTLEAISKLQGLL